MIDIMVSSEPTIRRCYWQEGRPRRPPDAPLTAETSADVAVIGAGYTGLSAAWHLKRAAPSLRIVVLEGGTVGCSASGRNAGFVMTQFGSSVALMHLLHGKLRMSEAHRFMERAIDALEAIIRQSNIDCDFHRTGFLRVATTPAYEKRLQSEVATLEAVGVRGLLWLDRSELAECVRSPTFRAACLEPGCGGLHPLKWLDGLVRLARGVGVTLHENSAVRDVRREGNRYRIVTQAGAVQAGKVVYATNGRTHLLPGMRHLQVPAYTSIVVTAPLTEAERADVGWDGREGIEDGRNFMHFFRLLPNHRLLAGGGPGHVPYGRRMDGDVDEGAWAHLRRFIERTFPVLRGKQITHQWGDAFSVTTDFTPHVRSLDGRGAYAAFGCTGHGVALTVMLGEILRDLLLERRTELTDLWFVDRRALPFPPEPLRWLVTHAAMGAMRLDDWWCDRTAGNH